MAASSTHSLNIDWMNMKCMDIQQRLQHAVLQSVASPENADEEEEQFDLARTTSSKDR